MVIESACAAEPGARTHVQGGIEHPGSPLWPGLWVAKALSMRITLGATCLDPARPRHIPRKSPLRGGVRGDLFLNLVIHSAL